MHFLIFSGFLVVDNAFLVVFLASLPWLPTLRGYALPHGMTGYLLEYSPGTKRLFPGGDPKISRKNKKG